MSEILAQVAAIVKGIGGRAMFELAKNWWVKFAIGVAIMAYPLTHLIVEVVRVFK